MRKFLFVLLVFVLFPCLNLYGQFGAALVFDSALNTIMEKSGIAQVIHYAQMVKDNVMQIEQFRQMIENTGQQIDMAVQNLKSIKDIGSWDDFMDFYNRQLYLERQTMQAYDNMNVTIGKKQYHISEINNIGGAMKDEYIDYWNKEFTEEQRKEMWMGLGLTPANYAYVMPYRAKANEIAMRQLTAAGIQNNWYMRQMERNKEIRDKLAQDQFIENPNEKMGAKEVMMMVLESLLDTNKVLNDMAMNQALNDEKEAVKDRLNNVPDTNPAMQTYPKDGFEEF